MGKRQNIPRPGPVAICLGAVLAAAFFFRLTFFLQLDSSPIAGMLVEDSRVYHQWALNIAGGDWLGREVFFALPFYPYFLGAVYAVFGPHLEAAKIVQLLLGTLNCWLIFRVGKRFFSPVTGLIGAAIMAGYGWLVVYDSSILSPTVIVTLSAVLLLLLAALQPRGNLLGWTGAGLVGGIAGTAGAHILIFLPVAAFLTVFGPGPESRGRKTAAAGAFLLGVGLVLGAVTWRNYAVGGEFVPLTAHGGINFYIGNNPSSRGVFEPPPILRTGGATLQEDSRRVAEKETGRRLTPSEVSSFWFDKSLSFFRSSPASALVLMGKKALIFWDGLEIADVIHPFFYREFAPILAFPFPVFSVVAPLCLLGLLVALPGLRKRRLLYAFVLAYYFSAVLYFINSRYRLPLVPFLLLFAGFALERGWTNLRRGRIGPILLSLPVLAFLVWVVNPQVLGISSPRFYLNMGAGHNHLGSWYTQRGDLERALKEFTEARRLEPYRAEANFNLGSTLLKMKRYREAEAYFREAIRINPFYESAHLALGYILEVSGETAAAEAKYREIIANLPDSPSAWLQLARFLIREGEPGRAAESIEEGLKRHGGNELFYLYLAMAREREGNLPEARAAVERGTAALPDSGLLQGEAGRLILKTGGDPDLAARYLERAVRLRPEDPLPRLWLGDLLAASDRPGRARTLWEEGAALAPGDPRFRERLSRTLP